jgi:hypothetical protein
VAQGHATTVSRSKSQRLLWRYWALIPITALAIWASAATPYNNWPPIRSDGVGYYSWTQALLQDNFDFCQWPELRAVHALSARNPAHPTRCENKYTPALALLRFPVVGVLAATQDPVRRHQLVISAPEERATLWLGALALVLESAFVLAALSRLGVDPVAGGLVCLATCFGTGLFHYDTYDATFTHGDSAMLFAGLVLLGISAAQRRRVPNRAVLFLLSLFIAGIREPDVVPLLALVAAWLYWHARPLAGDARRRLVLGVSVPVIAALVLVGAFQILYNHWAAGAWTISSYGQETFTPAALNEGNVLFSPDHGLLLWYPVVGVLLAVALIHPASRAWGAVALGVVVLLTLVYGSWYGWDLGGGFGHRGFVDVVPVVAVAGGLGLAALERWGRTLATGALMLGTLVTVELMAGYWTGSLSFQGTTLSQYWQHIAGAHSFFAGVG